MNLYNIIYTGAHQAYDAANGALTAAIAEKGKDYKTYFTMKEYKEDEKNLKGYTIKYIKGLGTLPNHFYREMMRNPHYQVYTKDDLSDGILRHWFAKGIAAERRETLSNQV